jgi:hypothetical protein
MRRVIIPHFIRRYKMNNFIEKYIDLTEYGADYEIKKHIAAGWYISHQGLTLVIMRLDIAGGEAD